MSYEIILTPQGDPSDWEDNHDDEISKIEKHLAAFSDGPIECSTRQTDHGIGADWTTILLALETVYVVFTAPAILHKTIRESYEEYGIMWKEVRNCVQKIIEWIRKKSNVVSQSRDIALLESLAYLDTITNVDNLVLLNYFEVPGMSGSSNRGFDTSALLYYQFTFIDDDTLYLLLYNSKLERLSYSQHSLDPRID